MKDCEMWALSAIIYSDAVLMQGENDGRRNNGYAPAWTSDCGDSDETEALRAELKRRGVLPKEEKK